MNVLNILHLSGQFRSKITLAVMVGSVVISCNLTIKLMMNYFSVCFSLIK
jgi:hypothetical protein